MSVQVLINQFKPSHIKLLNADLHVKPIEPPQQKSKFFNNPFQKKSNIVEAFDTFEKDGKEIACIPFSYYFHNLESLTQLPSEGEEVTTLGFKGSLLPRQVEVKDEIVEILNRTGSVVLSLHTGFGKTVMALYLCSKIGERTIIFCHRKIIIDQWVNSVIKYLPNATYAILGEDVKKKEKTQFPNRVNQDQNPNILICNVINVPKSDRDFYKTFGLVIVDEIHTICTESFSKSLRFIFPNYIIGLSATPFRTDGMDRLIELFCGPEMVIRKMWKHFNVYKLKTNFKPDTKFNISGTLDWNSVLEAQSTDKSRNQLIVDLCRYFHNRNILVLVKRKEHALTLKEMLTKAKHDVDVFMDTQKNCNYECRILIATYSKGGVGFDHPKLDMLISGADVQENFMQYIGRIFRRDDVAPIYVDLIDDMNTIKKHSAERLKICKEIGGNVKDFQKAFPDFTKWIHLLNRNRM